jgi:hypothetical protein
MSTFEVIFGKEGAKDHSTRCTHRTHRQEAEPPSWFRQHLGSTLSCLSSMADVSHYCSADRGFEEREEYWERNGAVDIELSEGNFRMFGSQVL